MPQRVQVRQRQHCGATVIQSDVGDSLHATMAGDRNQRNGNGIFEQRMPCPRVR
jgi:hypothetical protein